MTASDVIVAMEELPDADIDTILGGERPLILAPHADDESLGCGGLIAACCERGQPPVVAILTDGACVPSGVQAISAGAAASTSRRRSAAGSGNLRPAVGKPGVFQLSRYRVTNQPCSE